LGLIVAIGAQNSYVLRLGLQKSHVGIAVAICSISDAILILAGVAGIGALLQGRETLLDVIRWIGIIYLSWFGLSALRRATKSDQLTVGQGENLSRRKVVLATLGFTLLNPHVYLDTVLLLGGMANQFGSDKWFFAIGAACGSLSWFSFLGFGAKKAAPLMAKPITWKILDFFIAIVMFTIAITLLFTKITIPA
jgi:L-lysine exporter family protein LysE/ArgO